MGGGVSKKWSSEWNSEKKSGREEECDSLALCPSFRNVVRNVQILARWGRVMGVVRGGIIVGLFYRMAT